MKKLFLICCLILSATFSFAQDFQNLLTTDNRKEINNLILINGINHQYEDEYFTTLLMIFAENGNLEQLDWLLSFGPDVNLTDNKGWNVIDYATLNKNKDVLCKVFSIGVDLAKINKNGNKLIQRLSSRFEYMDEEKCIYIIDMLQTKLTDEDLIGSVSFVPSNYSNLFAHIVSFSKSALNYQDQYGQTYLYQLCDRGEHLNEIKILLKAGANPDIKNFNAGMAPLHIAVARGKFEIVEALVSAGASVNIANKSGGTPLSFCDKEKQPKIYDLLIANHAILEVPQVYQYVEQGKYKLLENALKNKIATANDTTLDNTPFLIAATNRNDIETVKVLLLYGGNVNVIDLNKRTSLLYAAKNGNIQILELLIKNKADLNATDIDGWNALHFAASNLKKEMVQYLLKKGINPKNETNNRLTATGILEAIKFVNNAGNGKKNSSSEKLLISKADEIINILK